MHILTIQTSPGSQSRKMLSHILSDAKQKNIRAESLEPRIFFTTGTNFSMFLIFVKWCVNTQIAALLCLLLQTTTMLYFISSAVSSYSLVVQIVSLAFAFGSMA